MPNLTNGLPLAALFTGSERIPLDTYLGSGANPQCEAMSISKLATVLNFYGSTLDKTTVAGTRYFSSTSIGTSGLGNAVTVTGVNVLIGSVGGTDKWIAELHDSTGAIVATSALAGITTGTAATWQQLAFTAAVSVNPSVYYIVIQSNGTTAKLATLNSPTNPHLTGSAAGTFGTSAAITVPTTYTANLGPMVFVY